MAFLHHIPFRYPEQTLLIEHSLLRLSTSEQTLLTECSLLRLATPGCHTRSVLCAVLFWNLGPWEHYSMKLTNVKIQVLLSFYGAK